MESTNGIKTWQWVVTAIVIVALIVVGIVVMSRDNTPSTDVDVVDTTDNTNAPVSRAANIIVSDQYPGNVVYVSSVSTDKAGWVVIHKNANGVPGAVIGSVYVNPGIAPAKVNLTESMTDGSMYYAMLHEDDGDKVFNATKDKSMTDARGNAIMKTFKASIAAGFDIKG
jgi:hypothetical protein